MPLPPLPNADHFGGERVRGKRRSYVARAGYDFDLTWTLEDEMGQPINLASFGVGTDPEPTILIRIQEHFGYSTQEVEATAAASSPGVLTAVVPADVTNQPGVYNMEASVKNSTGTSRKLVGSTFLLVERSTIGDAKGIPQFQEMRLTMRDYSMDNILLDAIDYDSSEVAYAIARAVSWWNETAPLSGPNYNTTNFPFHDLWLKAASVLLFETAAEHYFRNFTPGRAVDDKNKGGQYTQRAVMARKEVNDQIAARKMDLSYFTPFEVASFPTGYCW